MPCAAWTEAYEIYRRDKRVFHSILNPKPRLLAAANCSCHPGGATQGWRPAGSGTCEVEGFRAKRLGFRRSEPGSKKGLEGCGGGLKTVSALNLRASYLKQSIRFSFSLPSVPLRASTCLAEYEGVNRGGNTRF